VKAALIQLNIAWEDRQQNYEKAGFFAEKAAGESCDLIVFPEMFNTGFSMNLAAISDEGIGETTSVLSEMAKKNNINLIAGFPIKTPGEDKGRNMAVAYDRKGMLRATYTKMHSFCLTEERKHYIAGDNVTTFDIDGVPSSIFICYDLRFPEVFRKVAKQVHAIFVIANWPTERVEHWKALLKARAIENQCFMIGVNRTGVDGNGIRYPGSSCVIDPMGNVICSDRESDEYLVCEFDPARVNEVRSQFPFLRDMRLCDDQKK
jgi:predicted amidohydrolase